MNGEDQPTNQIYYQSFWRNLWNILKINNEKPKDHNMDQVWLGKTRILIDYAQKSHWTLRMNIYLFWKNKVHLSKIEFLNLCFLAKKINKNHLK